MSNAAALDVFDRRESEVRSYFRAFPTVFDRASGSTLVDDDGREYLDFFAGAGVLNYGHNNPALKRALIDYLERDGIIHGLDMATSAKKAFLEAFEQFVLAPRGLDHKLQFPGPTGANAVEAALKLARKATGRSTVVAFTNAFHGLTLGSLAATGNSHYRGAAGVGLDDVDAPALRRLPRRATSTRSTCSRRCSTTRAPGSTCPRPSSSRPCRARAASTSRARSGCSACASSPRPAASCSSSTRSRRASAAPARSSPSRTRASCPTS